MQPEQYYAVRLYTFQSPQTALGGPTIVMSFPNFMSQQWIVAALLICVRLGRAQGFAMNIDQLAAAKIFRPRLSAETIPALCI